jgi:HlyD family secretion protein
MYVVAEVYETDISLIKPGQKAMITSPALPTPVMGVVAKIGKLIYKNNLIGDDPAADTDARVVEVKVRLNNENNLASNLSNLKVDVKIQLNSKQINANH